MVNPLCILMPRRKAEVMNLLETAGFSCANPYYVVQQGKVRGLMLWWEGLALFLSGVLRA